MDSYKFSPNELLVLVVLMTESRTVKNSELKSLGPVLTANERKNLVGTGLISEERPTRFIELAITQKGIDYCSSLFTQEPPKGANPATRAAFTLMRNLERFMDEQEFLPVEVFRRVSTEDKIREMYTELAAEPGSWVEILKLRNKLPRLKKSRFDAALVELQKQPGVSLIPEENQKTLTDAQRRAAVIVGTQATHLLAIERLA